MFIDLDITDWKREPALKESFIEIMKVDANPDLLIFVGEGDNIGQPIKLLLLPNEAKIHKLLEFRLEELHDLWLEPSLLFLDQPSLGIDIKFVHGYLRVRLGMSP